MVQAKLKIKFKGLFGAQYSFRKNGAVCEIMWTNVVEPGRPLTTM